MVGKFIGVGIGPGDPELITVKALNALRKADVICVPHSKPDKPSLAFEIVKQIIKKPKQPTEILNLVFPMTKNSLELKKLWVKNSRAIADEVKKGKNVVFITLGDPMVYSTFLYLIQNLKEIYPEISFEIIPGVTSITAAAASAKLPLTENDEVTTIIPSDSSHATIEEAAKHAENIVIMKCAHRLKELVPIFTRSGFNENSTVALVTRCTLPEERVFFGKLGDVQNWEATGDYFSLAIIKKYVG